MWFLKGLERVEEGFVAVGLLAATGVAFAAVVARYVFQTGVAWSEELVRYIIIWISFVAVAIAVRGSGSISIDLFVLMKRPLLTKSMLVAHNLVGLAFSAAMLWWGTRLVQRVSGSAQVSVGLDMPMWIFYLILPIGGGLLLLRYSGALWLAVQNLIKDLRAS